MKQIRRDEIIVSTVTSGTVQDAYAVSKGVHLFLVYTVSSGHDAQIQPEVHLNGQGARATVIGLISGTANARIRIHTLQHHAAPDTTSNLLVKCVMRDASQCDYTGSIVVDKIAQKTNAYQRNENLLLDTESKATSSPALEILANDVRCTHGAVVKTLDKTELWYLESRGIDRTRARDMIAEGFLRSAADVIPDSAVREQIGRQLGL